MVSSTMLLVLWRKVKVSIEHRAFIQIGAVQNIGEAQPHWMR